MAYVEMGTLDGYYDEVNNEKGITADVEVFHVSGKIRTDTPLLTTSQDVAGAINELFSLEPEGGDKWAYPTDWIQMPEPEYNQYIAIISTAHASTVRVYAPYNTGCDNTGNILSIDWGDGNTDSIDLYYKSYKDHIYTAGTGTTIADGTEQFKITVTMPDACLTTHGVVAYGASITEHCAMAMAYGDSVKMWDRGLSSNRYSLHQIKLPANFTPYEGADLPTLQSHRALKKIITPTPLTALPNYFVGYCYSLETFDLSAVQTIGDGALAYCTRLLNNIVTLPNVQTIGSYGIANCTNMTQLIAPMLETVSYQALTTNYSLRVIDTPLLASVGNAALQYNESLTKFTYAEGCIFGTHATQNCYNLYPNPAP